MFYYSTFAAPSTSAMDLEEGMPLLSRQSSEEASSMREKFCRIFFMALSFVGFVIGIASLFYFIHINHDYTAPLSWEGIGALFVSVVCLTVFFALVDLTCFPSSSSNNNRRQQRTVAAVPIPVATMEEMRVVFRRSQSEKALTEAPERDNNLTRSLPPYILLSTDQMQGGAATSSMDLFLSAESRQTDSKETSTETDVKPSVTTPTPVITISEVETLPRESDGDASEIPAAETKEPASAEAPSNAADEEGIRKRKITPPEEQKFEQVPEKTE